MSRFVAASPAAKSTATPQEETRWRTHCRAVPARKRLENRWETIENYARPESRQLLSPKPIRFRQDQRVDGYQVSRASLQTWRASTPTSPALSDGMLAVLAAIRWTHVHRLRTSAIVTFVCPITSGRFSLIFRCFDAFSSRNPSFRKLLIFPVSGVLLRSCGLSRGIPERALRLKRCAFLL